MSSREDPTSGGPTERLQTSLSSTYRLRHCSDSLALFIKPTPALLPNRSAALLLALLRRFAKPQPSAFLVVGFAPSLCQTSIVLLLCCWLCSVALPNLLSYTPYTKAPLPCCWLCSTLANRYVALLLALLRCFVTSIDKFNHRAKALVLR